MVNRRRVERAPRITIEDILSASIMLGGIAEDSTGERREVADRMALWLRAEADQRTLENETRRRVNEARRSRRGILA